MDPGGSDLESSLPQAENPCLIVEDSQPDSVALEDDPDSSYRALLARRFSNLQPASHSPVLELISSPSKGRCSQSDSQLDKPDGVPHADNLQRNLSLSATEHSQVFEVCSHPNTKRRDQEDMDSRADSTTHCAQTEEGMSQFGLLELSESQGIHEKHDGDISDEDVEATPANLLPPNSPKSAIKVGMESSSRTSDSQDGRSRRPEVSSSSPSDPQTREGRKLSIQAILHSQVPESGEAEDEEIVSSQDDLFDGEHNGSKVDSTVAEPEKQEPTSTPARSLRLLHLSGQGILVQESLSQQSVDFVAATQEGLSQAPIIVPNSPTGQDNEHECGEAAESPMDTSGPPEDHAQKREEEPMDTDPVPKPTTSSPVSQNSPSVVSEKNLSLPTQPEFSHDVFVPTPCLECGDCSQSADTSKRKASQKENPSTTLDAEPLKMATTSQPSEVEASLHLALNSENSVFDKKTQVFPVDDGSQDTQIDDVGGTVGAEERDSSPGCQSGNSDKNGLESGLSKTASSQQASQRPDVESTRAACGANEEIHSSQKSLSPSADGRDTKSGSTAELQRLPQGQSAPDAPLARPAGEEVLDEDLTDSTCSRKVAPPDGAAGSACADEPSQSQSVLSLHKNIARGEEEEEEGLSHQRPSQPMSQSHRINSIGNAEDGEQEDGEEERMDEGEVQSTSRSEGSGLGLAISQSQAHSPEPMEEGEEVSEPTASGGCPVGGKGEGSFTITVLEESQRASQDKAGLGRLQPLRSASQPATGTPREMCKTGGKATSSQPSSSEPGSPPRSRAGSQVSKAGDGGGRQGPGAEGSANKSLSDSSEELPFHFTLPRDGELMEAAVSTTPPHVRQLKNTPLHSTPIEMSSFRERSEGDVTRETTMVASKISVEESAEGEEPAAKGGDGKLSLRMKVVSPVEEGSLGSERFSLQKPPLSDEEGSVSKATTVVKAVTSPSVFSRVREVHRQLQVEEMQESSDLPLRHQSLNTHSLPSTGNTGLSPDRPLEAVGNGMAGGLSGSVHRPSQQPNGTVPDAQPLAATVAQVQPCVGGEQEAPSTSGQALSGTPVQQRAVSQQTSIDFTSTTSPVRKRAVAQQTSLDISGSQLLERGEPVTPSRSQPGPVTPPRSQPGPSHRRHIRTVQEVRTTVTRIITDVYYEDGREVDRKVVEESEEPVVERCVLDSDVSPSRTGTSMTSGDLADVSSLSSKAPSHHSSSGTSSAGPGTSRAADFIMPAGRGAKSGSPRRGGRQHPRASVVGGSEFMGVLGSPGTTAPLSPRGHARRGRPPSRTTLSRGGRGGQRGGAHGLVTSSSEEDLVARSTARIPVIGAGRSDTLNAASPESSGGGSSFVGLRVMAKWSSNSYFYSGTITQDLGESHFQVLFDDNQECEVPGKDVLLCDPIPVEAEVTALTEEEYFNTGMVKGHKRQGSELLYCVEKDGQVAWYGRTAVILTMEQGNRLREQHGLGPYEPPTPQVMASDISLDNLVEGKRRRRGNGNGNGPGPGPGPDTPNRSSANSPRTPGKRKLAGSVEEEKTPAKRGRRGGGARAGSRAAACNTSGSGAELPADPNDLLMTHGPLPESASLFMGFVFMLTSSSEHDRETNETTCDGEEDYVQTAPYNKRYTERQLEAGGGMILPEFNEEQCKAAYQSLLIADQHCRTRTYLLCVAGGVPCVSQVWVRDCCQEKKLMNYRNYLLPAGLGPEKRIIEWHARCNPFKALKVLLFAENRVDLWTALLTMCGAAKVHHHKTNGNGSDVPAEKFDLVVSAHACSPDVLGSASAADTPVASLEWLIQSVICGERLAYDSRPEYSP